MGFFSLSEDDDKWKQKFLQGLDEQEKLTLSYQQNEAILCKTIIRLALAAKGLNKQLDPHLTAISNHLKKGLNSEQLSKELEDFSHAIMHMEENSDASGLPDASLLFDFLQLQFTQASEINAINDIKSKYQDRKYSSSAAFFADIAVVCKFNDAAFSPPATATKSPKLLAINTASISKQLLQLIDNIEIPPQLEVQSQPLRKKLQGELNQSDVANILDDSVALLISIKKFNQSEQKELEVFLSNITEQLIELGNMAVGTNSITQEQENSRHKLDFSVSEQMQQLRLSSADATKLEPLKQLINTRLTSISQQLLDHNNQEKTRQNKTQQQLRDMTAKISTMEAESNELKTRLAVAHDKALRDPLTELPNRLAFDERKTAEIARWNRYKSPLSLLIWDIDHFKNINDCYGHKSGDKALQLIAQLLSKNCRQMDFVARYGGEEFVMLLPGTSKESALKVAETIRKIIAKTGFRANAEAIKITISCGISHFSENDTFDSVFERADLALYQAKTAGRNQCAVF